MKAEKVVTNEGERYGNQITKKICFNTVYFYPIRGSQYRVEATLLRQARGRGFLCLAPSKRRVALQPPLYHRALLLEPESGKVFIFSSAIFERVFFPDTWNLFREYFTVDNFFDF